MNAIHITKRITSLVILTFLLLSHSQIYAQYKLELDWQKDMERIVSITKSDNDSLLYVAFENLILTVKTSDGSIVKSDSVVGSYNLKMSSDGKTLVVSDSSGVGMLDPLTFKRIYWENIKYCIKPTLSINECLKKYIICNWSNKIYIYDYNTESLIKELSAEGNSFLNVKLNIDSNNFAFSYTMEYILPKEKRCYLNLVDLNGNILKDFGETNSNNFTFSNDGKYLIYFKSDSINIFDLKTMKEKEGIHINNAFYDKKPISIEASNDNNFILVGTKSGLIYCNLSNRKTYYIEDFGTWNNFVLDYNDSTLYATWSNKLFKFIVTPTTSNQNENYTGLTLQVQANELILTNSNLLNENQTFNILSLEGKLIKILTNNEVKQSSNETKIDISTLTTGIYFLQIIEANKTIATKKFVKE